MRRSRQRWLLASMCALDGAARLAAPASLWAAVHDSGAWAVGLASATTCLSAARAVLGARAHQRALENSWLALVAGVRAHDPLSLRARFEREGAGMLADAARIQAEHEAGELPHLIATVLAALVVSAVSVATLGAGAVAAALLVFAVLGAPIVLLRRGVRAAQQLAYERAGDALRTLELLVGAAPELRAHDAEVQVEARARLEIDQMARAERRVRGYGLLVGLFPVGVALVCGVGPLRAWIVELAAGHWAEGAILGATGLALGASLVQGVIGLTRSAPYRRALAAFTRRPSVGAPESRPGRSAPLLGAPIAFRGLCIRHAGAADATPRAFDCVWPPDRGLAVLGENGSGKTSLALCLLGLVAPTSGDIAFADVPHREVDWAGLRRRCVYVPQQPYVVASASVRENVRLLSPLAGDDDALMAALERVGLRSTLEAHARGTAVLDVKAGELSGGERRRLHLARAFLGNPELVVLDEPEAGLDETGRRALRLLLSELEARPTRVLAIVHDPSTVPETFLRARCRRGPSSSVAAVP